MKHSAASHQKKVSDQLTRGLYQRWIAALECQYTYDECSYGAMGHGRRLHGMKQEAIAKSFAICLRIELADLYGRLFHFFIWRV